MINILLFNACTSTSALSDGRRVADCSIFTHKLSVVPQLNYKLTRERFGKHFTGHKRDTTTKPSDVAHDAATAIAPEKEK